MTFLETPELVTWFREFGIPQITLAEAIGVTERAVRSWEAGGNIRQRHEDRLRHLAELVEVLSHTLTPKGVKQWLVARNRLLEGRPVDLLRVGELDVVMAAANGLVEGAYA